MSHDMPAHEIAKWIIETWGAIKPEKVMHITAGEIVRLAEAVLSPYKYVEAPEYWRGKSKMICPKCGEVHICGEPQKPNCAGLRSLLAKRDEEIERLRSIVRQLSRLGDGNSYSTGRDYTSLVDEARRALEECK